MTTFAFDPFDPLAVHPDQPAPEEETLETIEKEEQEAVELGTTYKEGEEQDLDDLLHKKADEYKKSIPPPEEL